MLLGDTKDGFVKRYNRDTYGITPSNAIVTLRNVDDDGSLSRSCARLKGALPDGSIAKVSD